jgi:dienelactone hydrolase
LDGVDPERIVAWGASFAGGHVFRVGAEDARLAAVVALTPACDGLAALVAILRREGLLHGMRLTALGLRDAVGALRGRPPLLAPVVGRPGEAAALTAPGALESYTAIAGEDWRNEIAARLFLQVGLYRPGRAAGRIACPVLVQIADEDRTAPPGAAMAAAERAGAEVRHYPCDHFDVYPGCEWFASVVEHQLAFLRRHLGTGRAAGAQAGAAA